MTPESVFRHRHDRADEAFPLQPIPSLFFASALWMAQ
jgi:hypothetical protein